MLWDEEVASKGSVADGSRERLLMENEDQVQVLLGRKMG